MNVEDVPDRFIDDPSFSSMMKTVCLGKAAGSESIYVNIDYIKPGGKSTKLHTHQNQEEFFLVLSGSGTLRTGTEEKPIKQGDFFAKPPGRGIAHQFVNTGQEVLQILDCGLQLEHDVLTYPDEDVVLIKPQGLAFRMRDALDNWSTDPNE